MNDANKQRRHRRFVLSPGCRDYDGRTPALSILKRLLRAVIGGEDKAVNRMHPDKIARITATGIDYCAFANNHVLDWGYAGLAIAMEGKPRKLAFLPLPYFTRNNAE
jgi:hypothetical protein